MKRLILLALGLVALCIGALGSVPARAQMPFLQWECVVPSAARPQGGYCPVNGTYPLPTTGSASISGSLPTGTNNIGNVGSISQYPNGAVPLSGSSSTAASANTVTLAAAVGKTTYVCSLSLTGGGATATVFSTVTVTTTIGGTLTYFVSIPAGATAGFTPLQVNFQPCVPTTATNTSIVITATSPGAGNTNFALSAAGYQL